MHPVDLCVTYGRSVQSKETGLIHTESRERIPLLENFCFALGLLRTKQGDNMREGVAIIRRLLHFRDQETGLFPRFVDQFPQPSRYGLILLPLVHIKREFIDVPDYTFEPKNLTEELLVAKTIPQEVVEQWDSHFGCMDKTLCLRGFEPETTLLDLIMADAAQLSIPRLEKPHPVHLLASLIYPKQKIEPQPVSRLLWGKGYSLSIEGEYGEEVPEEGPKSYERTIYVSRHPDLSILVNGKKSTTFRLDDTVQIQTPEKDIDITFEITEGSGKLFGHIRQGNRSRQLLDDAAYDWCITLRTLTRSSTFSLECRTVDRDAHSVHAVVDVESSAGHC